MLRITRSNAKHNCNSSLFVSFRHMCIFRRRCTHSTTMLTRKQSAILSSYLPTALACTHHYYHSTNRNINESVNVDNDNDKNNISTSVNSFALLQNILQENEKIRDLYNNLCKHIVNGNALAAAEHARMLTEIITYEKCAHDTHMENNNNSWNCKEKEYSNTEIKMHNCAEPVAITEPVDFSIHLELFMDRNVKSNATKQDDDDKVEVDDDMPSPRHDDVEDAVLAAEREFRRRSSINNRTNCNEDGNINTATNVEHPALATLLTSSKHLCITIIETAFEAVDSSDVDDNANSYSNYGDVTAAAVSKINEESTAGIGKTCNNKELTNGSCDRTEENIDSSDSSDETDSKSDVHTRILNEYLTKEATKWKAQKNAIAKVILDTAQRLHITPLSLLEAEDTFPTCTEAVINQQETSNKNKSNCTTSLRSQWRLWKHCNVVVRGELPETAQSILRHSTSSSSASSSSNQGKDDRGNNVYSSSMELERVVDRELEMLKRRLADQRIAFSHEDEHLARVELCLQHCTMRYVIGIHRQLQVALDSDKGLYRFRKQHNFLESSDNVQSGSEFFIHEVMQALNSVPSSLVASFELMNSKQKSASDGQQKQQQKQQEENELKQSEQIGNKEDNIYTKNNCNNWQVTEDDKDKELLLQTLATPVIPYTFMLKCCLWFDISRSDLEQ